MKKESKEKLSLDDVIFIGKTNMRYMLSAVYDETHPLHDRNFFREADDCGIRSGNRWPNL